jgi:hypothetical protein
MEQFDRIPEHEPMNDNANAIADIFSLSLLCLVDGGVTNGSMNYELNPRQIAARSAIEIFTRFFSSLSVAMHKRTGTLKLSLMPFVRSLIKIHRLPLDFSVIKRIIPKLPVVTCGYTKSWKEIEEKNASGCDWI